MAAMMKKVRKKKLRILPEWTVLEVVGKLRFYGGTIMASSLAEARKIAKRQFKPIRNGRLSLTRNPLRRGGVMIMASADCQDPMLQRLLEQAQK